MNKNKQTEAQRKYKKFNKASKNITACILLIGFIALTGFLVSIKYIENNLIPVLVSAGLLVLWFIALCAVASKLNSKRLVLYNAAYGKEDVIHTGLFGEIWEEFEWNQFEGLTDGKVVFAETHNNTIELEIIRRKHEFNVTIDKDAIYMVMDDETETPLEKEIPLSELSEVGQAFTAIREFVESV